jgi:arylsulfatase A-like enzyme
MRTVAGVWVLVACAVFELGTAARGDEPAPKPNVVFFLIDDLAYADCGFNGGREIRTPEIDRLASGGAVLDALYVQPVCSPTRAALMTGRYATRTGVYTIVRPKAKWGLPLEERTLAVALREAGYETAIVGKWHLGEFERAYLPTARGFDHQYGHYFGAIDHFKHVRDGNHDWHRDDAEVVEEGYSTELLAKEACRLIETRDASKPLFLYVPFNAVHAPLQVPERYLAPYGHLSGPRKTLAGMLAAVDEGIGRIVATLEAKGIRDNTLIVFSTDTGGPKPGSNGVLRDFKGSLYEGGVRGCGFVNWPSRVPSGVRIKEPIHTVDWYPTLVNLAGGTLEQKLPLDGRDAWPTLTKGAPSPHDAILCVQSPAAAAVRMGDWKLVVVRDGSGVAGDQPPTPDKARKKNRRKGRVELFDLKSDPGEAKNLADQEPERVKTMRARLDEFLRDAAPQRG